MLQHLYKIFGDSKDCKQDRSGEVGPRALSMASIYNLWLRPIRQCPLSNTEEPHWLHGLIERLEYLGPICTFMAWATRPSHCS